LLRSAQWDSVKDLSLGWRTFIGKENSMETIRKIGWADLGSWPAALASLLPLWLFALAVSAEGFPRPPILVGGAYTCLFLALALSILLLWKGWLTFELLLYSLFPFLLFGSFDEISTSYKTPFILLCALVLTIGIIGYQRCLSRSLGLAWLILLVVFVGAWIFTSHAAWNYWQMVGHLRFPADCMPYTQDCPLLAGHETPWWILFFKP
jgi:hypothetical protein